MKYWLIPALFGLLELPTVQAQGNLRLEGIPGKLEWHNTPTDFAIEHSTVLRISSGPKTDWFVNPFDGTEARTAPILMFTPATTYILSAKVQVKFSSQWDAGTLMLFADDHHWAKLAFELSPQNHPTIVSVVTRGLSDDCNSMPLTSDTVYLRIARTESTYVFYYSTDGSNWNAVRIFSLDTQKPVAVGFASQSPDGAGSRATFSEIKYSPTRIANVYTGQ